ncbi:MerR family transcriptional regulator [Salipiger thiooxidans]|jgi:DNA-binding transcriptional MerR regulator|uniref:MerR family transcriptional regulator n=1 Tax=Salipiger thiooxidans TaxID=282683 RepID=UPI001CD5072D|nr:MerR family transcriptional regulator [Salipiger thiooxidans]MCA0848395.1 MerR family transcriptional regulator [Salipiger thiooxidans]
MRIAEFAQATGFAVDTLRYYEKIGLIEPPLRDSAGHRVYGPAELRWAEFLGRLKTTGMPISGMLAYARARAEGEVTTPERARMLREHRAEVARRVAELQDCLSVLDSKIASYEATMSDAKGPDHVAEHTGNTRRTRPQAAR